MNFDRQTQILLQRLSGSQAEAIHNLVELGFIQSSQLEALIHDMTKARFKKGEAYIEFASSLDVALVENQTHIVSRNYYGMYHLARATVFHTHRRDIDSHDRLPEALGQIVGVPLKEKLEQWRDVRNDLEYSPYTPTDMATICSESMNDAQEILTTCKQYLKGRGVDIEDA